MLCYVIVPDSLTEEERKSPECISKFRVKVCSFEPCHEIMVLFILHIHSSNVHVQPSIEARCLIFWWVRLLPYFRCANRKGSGETTRMHRLTSLR